MSFTSSGSELLPTPRQDDTGQPHPLSPPPPLSPSQPNFQTYWKPLGNVLCELRGAGEERGGGENKPFQTSPGMIILAAVLCSYWVRSKEGVWCDAGQRGLGF